MAEKVAMLVDRAALDGRVLAPERAESRFQPRGAVDDHEGGALQPVGVEVFEELPPRRRAFAAHVLDGQQDLLAIAAHADGRQHGDVRGLPVQPRLTRRVLVPAR